MCCSQDFSILYVLQIFDSKYILSISRVLLKPIKLLCFKKLQQNPKIKSFIYLHTPSVIKKVVITFFLGFLKALLFFLCKIFYVNFTLLSQLSLFTQKSYFCLIHKFYLSNLESTHIFN